MGTEPCVSTIGRLYVYSVLYSLRFIYLKGWGWAARKAIHAGRNKCTAESSCECRSLSTHWLVCVCVFFFQTLFFSSFFCENKSFKGWKKGRATRYTRENSWINKCQSVRRQTSFETRFQPIHILYSVHTNTTGGRFHPLEKGLNRTPATMMCYDLTP